MSLYGGMSSVSGPCALQMFVAAPAVIHHLFSLQKQATFHRVCTASLSVHRPKGSRPSPGAVRVGVCGTYWHCVGIPGRFRFCNEQGKGCGHNFSGLNVDFPHLRASRLSAKGVGTFRSTVACFVISKRVTFGLCFRLLGVMASQLSVVRLSRWYMRFSGLGGFSQARAQLSFLKVGMGMGTTKASLSCLGGVIEESNK